MAQVEQVSELGSKEESFRWKALHLRLQGRLRHVAGLVIAVASTMSSHPRL